MDPRHERQQKLLSKDVGVDLDKEGKRGIKIDKRSNEDSVVIRLNEGTSIAASLTYLWCKKWFF